MTVKVSRPSIDIRGTLDELNKPSGIAGNAMLAAETPQEQFNLIGAGRKNLLINSEFRVNQRGNTSFSGVVDAQIYPADRWLTYGNGVNISGSVYSVTLPDGTVAKSLKTVATTAAASFLHPYQKVETYGRDFLNGKKVVLSAWVRTSIPNQFFRICDTYSCYALGDEIPYDGKWHKVSVTHTLPVGMNTGAADFIQFQPLFGHADLAVGDYVEFALPQMEVGSVATPFEHRSYGEELALCQRYYCQSYESGTLAGSVTYEGALFRYLDGTHNWATFPFQFPTPMRLKPSMRIYNPATGALNSMSNDASNKVCGITAHGTQTARARISNITTYQSTSFTFHYTADAEL